MKDNYCDYSSILKKDPPIYDFCLYTPSFSIPTNDHDGRIDQYFYYTTNQQPNEVPTEMSDMNREKLKYFMQKHVPNEGFIAEIGVWRNPGDKTTSTQLFLENKHDATFYLGIDIEPRPHVDNYKPLAFTFCADSTSQETRYVIESLKRPIDFLFIDGLHSVEKVGQELDLIKYVRKGGVIGFHDISFHAGPNLWLDALKPDMFNIYKYHADNDWGIGFIVKKY